MQYKNLTNLENAYTVGMQNSNASDGFHIVYNQPYLHDQMAILISKRSWVSIHPVGGTIAPGEQTTMDVMFKTDNFPYGDFWASVEIYSNDPDEGTVIVPLHLVVSTVHSLNTLGETLPTLFRLEQNYPNPFNPSTIIRYELPQTAAVRLDIYNVRGQKVRSLVNTHKKAGRYSVQWDARNDAGELVASGIWEHFFTAVKLRCLPCYNPIASATIMAMSLFSIFSWWSVSLVGFVNAIGDHGGAEGAGGCHLLDLQRSGFVHPLVIHFWLRFFQPHPAATGTTTKTVLSRTGHFHHL